MKRRTLDSLVEGGEQAVRLDIASNQLYFKVEWEDSEDGSGWLPVTLANDGYPVKCRRSASLNKQIRYWDKVLTGAVNRDVAASGFALSWGWAILSEGNKEAASQHPGFINSISHW